jgi:uridine kinase
VADPGPAGDAGDAANADAAADDANADAALILYVRIRALQAASPAPLLVALDGRSGVGKSTVARGVAAEIGAGALVIDGDDFYCGGDDAYWDALAPTEKVDLVIDWRRQRTLLECLRREEPVTWRPYDWDADDGRLAAEVTAGPAGVVILDGAYSARPELADLFSLRGLDAPRHVRRARLLQREGAHYRAEWEARWGEAEDLYFGQLMPPSAFDLVLDGSGNGAWS